MMTQRTDNDLYAIKDWKVFKKVKKGYSKTVGKAWRKTLGSDKVKKAIKGVWQGTKSVGLAVPRGAFLSLTALNVFGMASKMAPEAKKNSSKWQNFSEKWYKMGGGRVILRKTVEKGAKKKPIAAKVSKSYDADGGESVEFYATGAEIMGFITTALPIIVKMVGIFGKPDQMSDETAANIADQAALVDEAFEAGQEFERNNPTPEDERDLEFSTDSTLWYIGGGLIAAGLITVIVILATRKRK
jgi:hypothetical protein